MRKSEGDSDLTSIHVRRAEEGDAARREMEEGARWRLEAGGEKGKGFEIGVAVWGPGAAAVQ